MEAYQKEISEEEYEEYLNEIYGQVDICGFKFYSGTLLKDLDPTAFSCGNTDYDDENGSWCCGICDSEYESEDEAEECCSEESEEDEEDEEDEEE